MDRKVITHRIDELLAIRPTSDSTAPTQSYQLYAACVTLISQLYGSSSVQFQALKDERARLMGVSGSEYSKFEIFTRELHGLLHTVKRDVEDGLLENLGDLARAEVYSDFLALAKNCLETSKDVAAVLASAALEDALKKFAVSQNLSAEDKDMSEVISLLKSKQLLLAPEAKVVQSFVTLRNKALHAEWNKIREPEVSSLVAYVETFILTKLANKPDDT